MTRLVQKAAIWQNDTEPRYEGGPFEINLKRSCADAADFEIQAVGGPVRAGLAEHVGYQAIQTPPSARWVTRAKQRMLTSGMSTPSLRTSTAVRSWISPARKASRRRAVPGPSGRRGWRGQLPRVGCRRAWRPCIRRVRWCGRRPGRGDGGYGSRCRRVRHGWPHTFGQEQAGVELAQTAAVVAGLADGVPADVVDKGPVVDPGEVASTHALFDAKGVAGASEVLGEVVGVAPPRGGGDTESAGRGEGVEQFGELAVLADVVCLVDHDHDHDQVGPVAEPGDGTAGGDGGARQAGNSR